MWNEETIKLFGAKVQGLINGQDLSRKESYGMFREVLRNEQPDLQQGAFLAALISKGETPQEIAGAWQAIMELDTNRLEGTLEFPVVENSGTGMDSLKTFNVSSAASVIAAAGGVRMARHGARAITSRCGTVDLLEAVGINVEADIMSIGNSIRKTGIGLFNGMSPMVHPGSLGRILSQIRFGSTLNIAASLASPCRPSHALRGVYSEDVIEKAVEVMKQIGYERAMVVHGYDGDERGGIDELSTVGRTVIHEFSSCGKEESYSIVPEDVGIRRAEYETIATLGDVEKEALRFIRVLSGIDHPECVDIACLNAGAIFYLAGKADDIMDGLSMGRSIVESGLALDKLSTWVETQRDPAGDGLSRFRLLAKKAGVQERVERILQ